MKKLILFFFVILLVGTVSAAYWDNVGNYYEDTKTMEIRSSVLGLSWWQLDPVVNITLLSPQHNVVMSGTDVLVAELQMEVFEQGEDPFEPMKFYDYYRRTEKSKDFSYKYLYTETIQVNDTQVDCSKDIHNCDVISLDTTHEEIRKTWLPFNEKALVEAKSYRIGIFTDVSPEERVEWIPTFFGVKIDEWADFTGLTNFEFYNDTSVRDDFNYVDITADGNGTQTFTIGNIGPNLEYELRIVQLFLADYSADNFTTANKVGIKIYSMAGGWCNFSDLLSENSLAPEQEIASAYVWHNFTLTNITTLSPATQYCLNINSTSEDDGLRWGMDSSSGTYTGGRVCGDRGCASDDDAIFSLWGNSTQTFPPVTLNAPANNYTSVDDVITFNCSATDNVGVINLSLYINDVINTTITNSSNNQNLSLETSLDFPLGENTWTCKAFDDEGTEGNTSTRNFSIVQLVNNEEKFNATTYETKVEDFIVNTTYNSTEFTTIAANLWYNGTSYTSTRTGSGDNAIFTRSLDMAAVTGATNRTFNWRVALTNSSTTIYQNTTTQTQTVDDTVLSLCGGAGGNTPFINFTFKNETTAEEEVNATIASSWVYTLGSTTVNNTLSLSNSTEHASYAFCLDPDNDPLTAVYTINYENSNSQQRTFFATSSLSNTTTNLVLYLLPTGEGLFSPFRTVNTVGDAIDSVQGTITRTLGGSTVTISSAVTDDSGFVTYFLDPDQTYTATFTKSGYPDNTFSFVPTTDTRTVIMGTSAGNIENGTQMFYNTSYDITPDNATLPNNTDVTFTFNLTSSRAITLISMNITNSSGSQLAFNSTAGQGFLSVVANTGNNTMIIGRYFFQTANESWSVTRTWTVAVDFIGDYSIFRQGTLYMEYGFADFWRLLFVLAIIVGVLIFMSAGEVTDTSESKVIVSIVLIWIFSIIGWLNTGLSSTSSSEGIVTLAQFSNQYGIAILSTAFGFYFIARRLFIRRI